MVVYGYAAPLGLWLLKALGHERVRMLMGSRDQWAQAWRQWSTAVPDPAAAVYPPLAEDTDLLAPRQAVEAAIDDPSTILLDVRAES